MPGCTCWHTVRVMVALACPSRSETTCTCSMTSDGRANHCLLTPRGPPADLCNDTAPVDVQTSPRAQRPTVADPPRRSPRRRDGLGGLPGSPSALPLATGTYRLPMTHNAARNASSVRSIVEVSDLSGSEA